MEREVGDSLQIGIMLILISVLISIVWFTVSLGLGMENSTEMTYARMDNQIQNSQLDSMRGVNSIIMPKASIYSIISQESNNVCKLTYEFANGKVYVITKSSEDDWECKNGVTLIKRFKFVQDALSDKTTEYVTGKVEVSVEKNDLGLYEIDITVIE